MLGKNEQKGLLNKVMTKNSNITDQYFPIPETSIND